MTTEPVELRVVKLEERMEALSERARDLYPLTREVIELRAAIKEVKDDVHEIAVRMAESTSAERENRKMQKTLTIGLGAAVISGTAAILAAILSWTGHA